MTACTTETIRIWIPRIPAVRRQIDGRWDPKWREWLHAVKVYSRVYAEGDRVRQRGMPVVEGPCKVKATVRWYDRHVKPDQFSLDRWIEGISAALRVSGIAEDITSARVEWKSVPIDQMGTDIEIIPLEPDDANH